MISSGSGTAPLGLRGNAFAGTQLCSPINTWFSLVSLNAPTLVIITPEVITGVIRISLSNSSAPSATFGIRLYENSYFPVQLGHGETIYVSSTVATDRVNWTSKQITSS